MLDDVERGDGHVEHLAAFPDERIVQWQLVATALALSGQRVINAPGRLHGPLVCTPI